MFGEPAWCRPGGYILPVQPPGICLFCGLAAKPVSDHAAMGSRLPPENRKQQQTQKNAPRQTRQVNALNLCAPKPQAASREAAAVRSTMARKPKQDIALQRILGVARVDRNMPDQALQPIDR